MEADVLVGDSFWGRPGVRREDRAHRKAVGLSRTLTRSRKGSGGLGRSSGPDSPGPRVEGKPARIQARELHDRVLEPDVINFDRKRPGGGQGDRGDRVNLSDVRVHPCQGNYPAVQTNFHILDGRGGRVSPTPYQRASFGKDPVTGQNSRPRKHDPQLMDKVPSRRVKGSRSGDPYLGHPEQGYRQPPPARPKSNPRYAWGLR